MMRSVARSFLTMGIVAFCCAPTAKAQDASSNSITPPLLQDASSNSITPPLLQDASTGSAPQSAADIAAAQAQATAQAASDQALTAQNAAQTAANNATAKADAQTVAQTTADRVNAQASAAQAAAAKSANQAAASQAAATQAAANAQANPGDPAAKAAAAQAATQAANDQATAAAQAAVAQTAAANAATANAALQSATNDSNQANAQSAAAQSASDQANAAAQDAANQANAAQAAADQADAAANGTTSTPTDSGDNGQSAAGSTSSVQDMSTQTALCMAYYNVMYTCGMSSGMSNLTAAIGNGTNIDIASLLANQSSGSAAFMSSPAAAYYQNRSQLMISFMSFGTFKGYTDTNVVMQDESVYQNALMNNSMFDPHLPGMFDPRNQTPVDNCTNSGVVQAYLDLPCASLSQYADSVVNGSTTVAPPTLDGYCDGGSISQLIFSSGSLPSDLTHYQQSNPNNTLTYGAGLTVNGAVQYCNYLMPEPIPYGQSVTYSFPSPPNPAMTTVQNTGSIPADILTNGVDARGYAVTQAPAVAACPVGFVTVSCQNGQPVITQGGLSAWDFAAQAALADAGTAPVQPSNTYNGDSGGGGGEGGGGGQ